MSDSVNDIMIGTLLKVIYDEINCKQLLLFLIKLNPMTPKSD